MKMECSGKREIRGEVKKEWMESVEEWKSVERKKVSVVKREERIPENEIHLSKSSSFEVNDKMIRCSDEWQSWIIDRELKSVCILSNNISLLYYYFHLLFIGSISIVWNAFYIYRRDYCM